MLPGWARRTTILLVMQTEDNRLRLRLGAQPVDRCSGADLVAGPDPDNPHPRARSTIGHQVTRRFAEKTDGIAG